MPACQLQCLAGLYETASSPTLKGTTPSSLVPSNVVNGELDRVIECFCTGKRPADRAWRPWLRVGGVESSRVVVLLLLARRNEGTTTRERRGASQSAATLCSAILSTHSPPRAVEAVTCLRSKHGSLSSWRRHHLLSCHTHEMRHAKSVPTHYLLQSAAARSGIGPAQSGSHRYRH